MDTIEQDKLLRSLTLLKRDIEEILAAKEPSLSEEKDDLMLTKGAHDYKQQISGLYRALANKICSCQRGHVAQLDLSNLGVDKETIDLYISICHEVEEITNSQGITWQLTKCSKKDQLAEATIAGSLCRLLNEARERHSPAMLTYSGKTISKDTTETGKLQSEDLLWSFVDLATVLDEQSGRTTLDCKISAADKLSLQCLLTQSLLFLYPSSWIPEMLRLDNIHFMVSKTRCNFKKPYLYCSFEEKLKERGMVDTDAVADFMIHFALLLLQIEVGQPLLLLPEENSSRYGHELALDRYMRHFGEHLNVHITQVLVDFLWFKRCLGQASHPQMPLELKIRFVVSQHVFKPLVRTLEFNWPDVAREIFSYSRAQPREAKVVDIESTSSTQKRRFSMIDQCSSKFGPNGIGIVLSEEPNRIDHSRKRVKLEGDMSTPSVSCHSRTTRMSSEAFTIGWISAIPIEMAVACAMLDEEYPKEKWPLVNTKADENSYAFGRLYGHNIVLACLPKGRYGSTSAAVVARDMRASFSIKFGLLVGVAGGAPSQSHDIRLGDVVIGTPTPGYPGVLQYDYGKAISQHEFKQTGHMTPPPENLLTTLANLEAHHKFRGHNISQKVSEMLARNMRLKRECSRPSNGKDRLFKPSFKHCSQCPCQAPDGRMLNASDNPIENRSSESITQSSKEPEQIIQVLRPERTANEDEIRIHYGLIASANQLMKDADARDRLAEKFDVLCFEMEAAGIVNNFPCVVIRGICDYSDSHKNDIWQGCAAANAAAYAKELLEIIPQEWIKDMKSSP